MRILKLVSFLILCTAGLQASAKDGPREQWFQCHHDPECTHIDYPCAGAVVNARYKAEADEYYKNQSNISLCERVADKTKIPYKVFCKKQKCGYQGVKPNLK